MNVYAHAHVRVPWPENASAWLKVGDGMHRPVPAYRHMSLHIDTCPRIHACAPAYRHVPPHRDVPLHIETRSAPTYDNCTMADPYGLTIAIYLGNIFLTVPGKVHKAITISTLVTFSNGARQSPTASATRDSSYTLLMETTPTGITPADNARRPVLHSHRLYSYCLI